jgi:FKBP-type peptidyl-prolyl cis-trans isomerase FkpA
MSAEASVSPSRAVALGHLTVTLPALIVMAILACVGGLQFGGSGALGGILLGSCVLGWPVWAWAIRGWRRNTAARVTDPGKLERLAVATGLIGPAGSVFAQAERTWRVPLMWGLMVGGLSVLLAFAVLTSGTTIAIGAFAFGCLALAAGISFDLRRSDTRLARLGLLVALFAAVGLLAVRHIPAPAWAAAAGETFLTAFAFCLVGLLIWLPASGRDRRRWIAAGLVVVTAISFVAAYAASTEPRLRAVQTSGRSSELPLATPKLTATWASFATGSDFRPTPLPDGLQITDVKVGAGIVARVGDALTVRYIMWLSNGMQADSSDAEGGPFKFTLGTGMVIQGWEEGVPGMRVGGMRRLVIPPALAYGATGTAYPSGAYVVPPNTKLVFMIELLSDTLRM